MILIMTFKYANIETSHKYWIVNRIVIFHLSHSTNCTKNFLKHIAIGNGNWDYVISSNIGRLEHFVVNCFKHSLVEKVS